MFDWLWGGNSQISKLQILHDGKKYALTFQKEDYVDKNLSLGTLKAKLAPLLDVPADRLTIYQTEPKRKLNNDNNTLKAYKISNNETLLVVGAKPKPLTPSEQIDAAVNTVEENLGSRIAAFCSAPPTTEKEREKEFLVLNEVILQNIVMLDGIEVDSPEVRQKRKNAINKLQKYHTDIDNANKKSLELIAKGEQPQEAEASPAPVKKQASPSASGQKKKKKGGKKR